MAFSWEPSEFDKTFVVTGALKVITNNGERVLGYPKPVSVSAENQRDAKAKVKLCFYLEVDSMRPMSLKTS